MFYDPAKTRHFKEILMTVAGQAFEAAHYQLEVDEMQQARGLIRLKKPLSDEIYTFIEWQLLAFEQSPFTRFQITLLRNQGHTPRAFTSYVHRDEQTLPWVIWHVYAARVLPSADYWWTFREAAELPHAIAAAGRLLFGYGVPWLEMHDDVPNNPTDDGLD